MWLTMADRGHRGVYVGGPPLFVALYDNDGQTKREGVAQAMQAVRHKHGLC